MLRTLLVVPLILLLSGCASLLADRITAPQNQPRDPRLAQHYDVLANMGIRTTRYQTSVGELVALEVPAMPMKLRTSGRLNKARDGSVSGNVSMTFSADKERATYPATLGTVVLLHGYALSKESMMAWASVFADAGFDAVVPDLPGHGESVQQTVTFGVDESRAIRELIDQLASEGKEQPILLFGVSLGASTALLASVDNEHVSAVAGIAPFNDPRAVAPNFRQIAPWWQRLIFSPATVRKAIGIADARAGFDFADAVITEHLHGDHETPTLLLASTGDNLVPPTEAQAIASRSDAVTLKVVDTYQDHFQFPSDIAARCRVVFPWLIQTLDIELMSDPCTQLRSAEMIMQDAVVQ